MPKLILFIMGALALSGCQKLVEVHTSRGDMERVPFRAIVEQIDTELQDARLTDGAIVSINYSGCTYTYHPAESITPEQLHDEITRRYQEMQKNYPFVIERIQYVRAIQRGVRVNRPIKNPTQ